MGENKRHGAEGKGLGRKDKRYLGQTVETKMNEKRGRKGIVRSLYVDGELAFGYVL